MIVTEVSSAAKGLLWHLLRDWVKSCIKMQKVKNWRERKGKESNKLVHPVSKVDHWQFEKTGKTIFYFLTQSSTLKLNRIARLHTPLFSSWPTCTFAAFITQSIILFALRNATINLTAIERNPDAGVSTFGWWGLVRWVCKTCGGSSKFHYLSHFCL